MSTIKAIIFDWGDTVMRDFPDCKGPMVNWPRVEMIKDIDNTLNILHKDFICCLASNAGDSDAELMGKALVRVNLLQYFKYLFTSRELKATKPDPAFYHEILRRLELEPEQCAVVGNDYQKDIVPARSMGMPTILFSQHPDPGLVPCADYLVDSMDKIVSVIEKIKNRIVDREGDILLDIIRTRAKENEFELIKLFPVAYSLVVAKHQGKYILVFNRFRKQWEVPGGRIEIGEGPSDCANRELLEESGQAGKNIKFQGIMKLRAKLGDRIKYGVLYSVELIDMLPFQANEEISEITLWDSISDIGYINEIDRSLLSSVSD